MLLLCFLCMCKIQVFRWLHIITAYFVVKFSKKCIDQIRNALKFVEGDVIVGPMFPMDNGKDQLSCGSLNESTLHFNIHNFKNLNTKLYWLSRCRTTRDLLLCSPGLVPLRLRS